MVKEKIKFSDNPNSSLCIKCSIGLAIEPYGYRQGQRVAVITLNDECEEMTLRDVVLAIYKLKTNCVTIQGSSFQIIDLIDYLQMFINKCMIHLNTIGLSLSNCFRQNRVAVTYDQYIEGMDERDDIVLFANNEKELVDAQDYADNLRVDKRFHGKVFIVHSELDDASYQRVIERNIHYRTKYQKMY